MAYRRTITLGLDYSEFSGGIQDAANKMKVLESQYRAAAEEARAFGDDSDQLRLQQEKLAQQIILQTRTVELSRRALEEAEVSGEASERQLDRLRIQYNNNRLQLERFNNELESLYDQSGETTEQLGEMTEQLEETQGQLGETEESERSFGDAIREVSELLGLDASPAVEAFAERFDGVNESVGAAVLTLGTYVTALGSLTMKTAESAENIANMSQTMGMTTDEYQEWDYVLKSVGYDAESASGDLAALAEKAMDAANGTGEGAEMFQLLGINVKNARGEIKSQNELFTEVILKLQQMEDTTKRNAIASAMLSTTGEQLVPILNMTREELQGLMQEAHATGYVMSGEALEGFNDLNDAVAKFEGAAEGLSHEFAIVLLPVLTALFNAISAIPTPVLQLLITFATVVTSLAAVVKAVKSVTGAWGELGDFMNTFDLQGAKTAGIIMGVVAALIALGVVIAAILGKADDLGRAMESVGTNVNSISNSVNQAQRQAQAPRYNARGTDYFEGGETWVGENGPEKVILPRGSQIISSQEASSSTVNYYNITIDAKNVKDFNRVVEIVDGLQQASRKSRGA